MQKNAGNSTFSSSLRYKISGIRNNVCDLKLIPNKNIFLGLLWLSNSQPLELDEFTAPLSKDLNFPYYLKSNQELRSTLKLSSFNLNSLCFIQRPMANEKLDNYLEMDI